MRNITSLCTLKKSLYRSILAIPVLLVCVVIGCARWQEPMTDTTAPGTGCATLPTQPPQWLSQTCLYQNSRHYAVTDELHKFTPNYQLWSDGADKARWIYLPPGTQIDTSNPDRWRFPVGTQLFKEFRKTVEIRPGVTKEIRVETRHLAKVKDSWGHRSWSISTYAWNENQQDAQLVLDGARHVLGTQHNIPSQQDCITCHKGNTDFILGFDAIQLSDAQAVHAFGHGPKRGAGEWTLQTLLSNHLLTHPIEQPRLPGDALQQKVLGYLHANCGNCHNPEGHAAEQDAEHLRMRHQLAMKAVVDTDVYRTAVNQPTKNFTLVPYIAMGAAYEEMALYKSALFVRMLSTDENYRMPMVARETVDYDAVDLMHQWLKTIDTPSEYDFTRDMQATQEPPQTALTDTTKTTKLSGPGLQILVRFNATPPPALVVYWPEDKQLNASPVMDHFDGDFTERLIVGNKGSTMSLRNSDEVGHTIYVKDKRQNVDWRLDYMPPHSQFKQALYWEDDVFVEMRCKLHAYMSAWVGSISSRYSKIVNLEQQDRERRFAMTGYPDTLNEVKVWLPHVKPIHTRIQIGETQRFHLKRGAQVVGEIVLKRERQK